MIKTIKGDFQNEKRRKKANKKGFSLKKFIIYLFLIIILTILLDTIFNPKKDSNNKSLYANTININNTLEKKETPQEFKKKLYLYTI